MSLSEQIHTAIFSGSLAKGGTWGGPECTAFIPEHIHTAETLGWIALCVIMYLTHDFTSYIKYVRSYHDKAIAIQSKKSPSTVWSLLDGLFLFVLFGLWFQVLYYKIQIKSLVNLLQPCHLSILWQGLSILTSKSSSLSPIFGFITLPMTIGAVAAVLVPATEGLDQPFEEISFFIQHYVLLITPLYLLIRQDFNLYKIATFSSVMFGNWFSLVLHWVLFSAFDRFFQVNVNFFLCPSEGLGAVIQGLPAWLVNPSYRTLIVLVFFFGAIPICYFYIAFAGILHYFFKGKDSNVDTNKKFK